MPAISQHFRETARAGAFIAAVVLVLPVLLGGSVVGQAHAAPGDPAEVTLTWPSLGLNPGMVLGPYSPTDFTMPVPAGLTAVRVRGMIHAPMNIDGGVLEINDGDGRFLAAVGLPPAASAAPVTPFDVDISAAHVQTSSVKLTFTVRPGGNYDRICGPLQQLTLSDLTTVFTGAEAPVNTVATFFPPVLKQVTLYVPNDASPSEQQAVLTLTSTLARIYRPQPLAISVVRQPRGAVPPPAPQMARAVVVEQTEKSGSAGLTVEKPGSPGVYVRVSGKGNELSTQVSLLSNQLQSLAQTPVVRVDQAGSGAVPSGGTMTFEQLGMTGSADVLRTSTMSVAVDRASLGAGRIDSVKVHLLASYTPVANDDTATVVIRSNGIIAYRVALDGTGVLDATFDLEPNMFGQFISLDFALTYTPHDHCGPLMAPISFEVDPRSTLTPHRGGAPLGGFGALPSEFSRDFLVALDGSSPEQLSYANQLVSAIARLTSSPLTPQVVDVRDALDANTGALIVANSATLEKSALNPLVAGDGTAVDVELPTTLNATMDGGLGSIQAFADHARNRSVILVTTTGSWSLVDPLFSYLSALEGGWSQLSGDLLAAGPAGDPTNLAIRTKADGSTDEGGSHVAETGDGSLPWRGIGVGIGVLALVAIGAAVLWRRRNSNR
ncbi:hypothetical protein [Mycobacterium syngnathidarum]